MLRCFELILIILKYFQNGLIFRSCLILNNTLREKIMLNLTELTNYHVVIFRFDVRPLFGACDFVDVNRNMEYKLVQKVKTQPNKSIFLTNFLTNHGKYIFFKVYFLVKLDTRTFTGTEDVSEFNPLFNLKLPVR